jgi:peptidyl-tRNA hydrolase
VEDIIQKLGTNEFWRFRVGVGKSPNKAIPTDEWVLMNFTQEELETISQLKPDFLS